MKRFLFGKRVSVAPAPKPLPPLALCLLLDVIGSVFITIPLLGPFIDMIWAPISAYFFFKLFGGGVRGFFGGAFSFFEEMIPGLNFIPTFTIAWAIQYFKKPKESNTIILRPVTH